MSAEPNKSLLTRIKEFYLAYPARINALVVAGLLALATKEGIVLDHTTTETVVGAVLLILAGGEITHRKVTPVNKS